MNKRKGVIMLEVLIIISLLTILILCNSKLLVANSSKLGLYEINEDILTLNEEENDLLIEFKETLKENKELYSNLKSYKDEPEFSYVYAYSKNNKLSLVVYEGKILIKRRLDNKQYFYKNIDLVFLNEEKREFLFIPKTYQIINSKEIGG